MKRLGRMAFPRSFHTIVRSSLPSDHDPLTDHSQINLTPQAAKSETARGEKRAECIGDAEARGMRGGGADRGAYI